MAAKQHTNFWGWASDHWFLTFLLASSAISIPIYAMNTTTAVVTGGRIAGVPRKLGGGRTPFPGSF